MRISRRRFLALSATFTAAACSGTDEADPGQPTTTGTDSPGSAGAPPTTAGSASPTTSGSVPATDGTTTTTSTTSPSTTSTTTVPATTLDVDPFAFGVASGDPDVGSVVIWTRLDGDLPADGIDVGWAFVPDGGGDPVEGVTRTDASLGGAVHVVVETDRAGDFVFRSGGWTSPTGRTAPIDPTTDALTIAAASCQNYEQGFYAAHRDIAEWRPDLVVFLGDFIYEGDAADDDENVVRRHEAFEPTDVAGYRRRYAQYLRDPHLQASRAAAPWLSIWDDHEVENNYAALVSEDDVPTAEFAERRLQAYRAWWENTPTRLPMPDLDADPTAPYPIHRGVDIGALARISVLDGRQFRDDQLSDEVLQIGPPVEGWDDPSRTMLGADQEAWIADRFATSDATWNCLAQQTVLGDTRLAQGAGDSPAILNYDQWDGYAPARQRLLETAPANFVTLTGDIHLAGVGSLGPPDAPVGVEFVTTGISSGQNIEPGLTDLVKSLPAIIDAELVSRGYTRHTVTPRSWTAEYRQVVDVADPDSPLQTWKTFCVDAGTASAREV